MLYTAFLSDNVRRCNVSRCQHGLDSRNKLLIRSLVRQKSELYLDKSGPEERSVACSNIHRLCYDLGAEPP